MQQRYIAEDLIETGPLGPTLVGGRRKSDGKFVFPYPQGSERDLYDRVQLGRTGKLWAWTVQRFRPKTPPYAAPDNEADFRPFVVGYVEIPGEVIVEARIEADPAELEINQELEMGLIPFSTDSDGTVVFSYVFRPIKSSAS